MKKMLFISLVLVFAMVGCGGASQPVTEVTVVASDFAYTPNMIYVPIGEEITITFRNEGQVEHDFVVAEISLADSDDHTDEDMDEHVEGEGEHMDESTDEHTQEGEHMEEEMDMDEHEQHADYPIHALLQPGDSATIKFTALETGEYEIFCTVQGHKDAGMIGTLVVVAQE